MKQVLIALDYNPSAEKVAETGHRLAKSMDAEVVLLHVVSDFKYYASLNYSPIMGFDSFSNVIETEGSGELKRIAQNYLDSTKKHLDDPTIKTSVKSGDFARTIMDTAKELGADIIVMGTHSRRGIEKILLGSVAENVLNHSTIPLFIIPTRSLEEK